MGLAVQSLSSLRTPVEARPLQVKGSRLTAQASARESERRQPKAQQRETSAGRRPPQPRDRPSPAGTTAGSRVTRRSRAAGSEGTGPCPDLQLGPPQRRPHALPWPRSRLAASRLPWGTGGDGRGAPLQLRAPQAHHLGPGGIQSSEHLGNQRLGSRPGPSDSLLLRSIQRALPESPGAPDCASSSPDPTW